MSFVAGEGRDGGAAERVEGDDGLDVEAIWTGGGVVGGCVVSTSLSAERELERAWHKKKDAVIKGGRKRGKVQTNAATYAPINNRLAINVSLTCLNGLV